MLIGQTVMMTVEELHQTTYSSTLHSNRMCALYVMLNRNEITSVIRDNLPCLERMGSVETALTQSFTGRTNGKMEHLQSWAAFHKSILSLKVDCGTSGSNLAPIIIIGTII